MHDASLFAGFTRRWIAVVAGAGRDRRQDRHSEDLAAPLSGSHPGTGLTPDSGFARPGSRGHPDRVHKISGLRDPAAAFPLSGARDDAADRREANRAVAVSAAGLGVTGAIELVVAVLTGSVGLLGDAIHNLSDV